MATKQEEGTGKHPHKSAADPTEHHEAASGKAKSGTTTSHSASESKSTKSESSDGQGTGKHKHKSAAEPYEHHGNQ